MIEIANINTDFLIPNYFESKSVKNTLICCITSFFLKLHRLTISSYTYKTVERRFTTSRRMLKIANCSYFCFHNKVSIQ